MMGRTLCGCAGIALAVIAFIPPARADIINLECHRGDEPFYLIYWIDEQNRTITYAQTVERRIDPNTVKTVPLVVTAQTYEFQIDDPVTIDRQTGLNVWTEQSPFRCAPAATPWDIPKR